MFRLILVFLLLFSVMQSAQSAIGTADPLYLGVGARPLGMGKAFNAVSNDGSTPFTNPAGLGFIRDTKVMSMATKILLEVDYQALGVAIPVKGLGTIGFGYVGRSIGQIALGTAATIVGGRLNPNLLQFGSISDQVMFASLGVPIGTKNDLSIGSTLRYYRKSSAGALLNGYDANGFDVDLGLLWQTNRNLRLSATLQNILPNGSNVWGGVQYANGTIDNIDAVMKFGLAYQMAGKRWLLAADLEKNLDQSTFPFLLHLGVEWHPTDELFFRAGLDQSPLPPASGQTQASTQTDPTMGVGFNWGGLRFDYAFHPYGSVDNLTSHFFSLSLVGAEPVEDEVVPTKAPTPVVETIPASVNLVVFSPADKTIVRDSQIPVTGMISSRALVRMDGISFIPDAGGKFEKNKTLDIGRNNILVSSEKIQVRRRVLRLARFNDVGEGAFKEPIELLATLGTISEDGDGFFNGKRSVTRAELADALVKIKKYQLPSSVAGVWENLDTVVNDGLIKGYPDGKYKTTKEVTNAQLAVVLARLEFGSDFRNEARSKHWADNAVNQLASAGVYQRSDFVPYNGFVSKEKLALMLYKTKIVRGRVDRLLNFEDGDDATPVEVRNLQKAQDREDLQPMGNSGVLLSSPINGSIVKKPETVFQGQARYLKTLEVNGNAVYLRPDGKFYQKFPLKVGKNNFTIRTTDNNGGIKEEVRTVIYKK